jgi:hypothetical protein
MPFKVGTVREHTLKKKPRNPQYTGDRALNLLRCMASSACEHNPLKQAVEVPFLNIAGPAPHVWAVHWPNT